MLDYFFSAQKKFQYKLLAGDLFIIAFTIICEHCIIISLFSNKELSLAFLFSKISSLNLIFIVLYPLFFYLFGLFSPSINIKNIRGFIKILGISIFICLIASSLLFFFPKYMIGRKFIFIFSGFVAILLYLWRLFFYSINYRIARRQIALVSSTSSMVSQFMEELDKHSYSEFEVKAICVNKDDEELKETLFFKGISYYNNIADLLNNEAVENLAVDSEYPFDGDSIKRIFDFRFSGNNTIYSLHKLFEVISGKVAHECISEQWFVNNPIFHGSPKIRYLKLKRIFDFSGALFFIIFMSPFFLLIALLIKMTSKGSVFFIQERLGKNRKPFKCIKFRTMIQDAETVTGPVWSNGDNDERITILGRFLRKTRLDELPQLFNILSNQMSFIGARPIREHFANKLEEQIPFYDLRFSDKPGLTGWAQVNQSYVDSVEGQIEKFQYELFYIQHMSLMLDLHILFKTLKTVFLGKGN